jgi:hypothetical protein
VQPDAFEPPAGQDGCERVTASDLPLNHFDVTDADSAMVARVR